MGRVLTNNVALQSARESSLGTAGTDWKTLEPNGINTYGATITTVAREPISEDKQDRKGTVTDLDSAVEFEADLTMDAVDDFIEAFCFANATNGDLFFTESNATGTGFTVAALDATQAGKLQFTSGGPISLLYARGYATAANNGLKAVNSDPATTGTELTVSGLTAETAPSKAVLEVAGIRAETGDLALAIAGTVGTLTSGNNGASNNIDFTTLGLTVGQFIHIGGLTSSEQFATAGFARITAIAAGTLTLDKLSDSLAADTGAGDTVDLLFGRFIRNVPVSDGDYAEISYHFEASFPNLDSDGDTMYEYAKGNFCNQVTFDVPLTDKATATFGFVGTDTDVPTDTQQAAAASPRTPAKTAALNTSSDVARLRITEADETGLTTDFKSLSITLNNNVSPEKVIGQLGAAFMNTGNFQVSIDAQLLFTNAEVVTAIRNNTTVTMDFILDNEDGTIAVDIPSMTLGGGGRDYPVNESVLINTTGRAFKDVALNTSVGISLFAITP